MLRSLKPGPFRSKRTHQPKYAIYRKTRRGHFEIDMTSGERPMFAVRPGGETSSPILIVGMRYPGGWRGTVADLRALADDIEFNKLPGPADWAALNEPIEPQESAA